MRSIWPIVVGLLIAAALVALLWPSPRYSRSKVDPSLLSLREPYRAVVTEYYLDGGSVGVRITDRNGKAMEYALPVSTNYPQSYERVFVGGMHLKDKGKSPIEVRDSQNTKNVLIRIIARYSPNDSNTLMALCALRGLPRDYADALLYSLVNRE